MTDQTANTLTKQAIYGLPISPNHLLPQLKGASFCVSYATRRRLGAQLDQAIELVGEDGILLIDNGAFTLHKQGVSSRDEAYLDAFEAWAQAILDRCPQAVVVVPDVIGGSEADNRELLSITQLPIERRMPIWHMHESLDYFLDLCCDHEYVGIGSSGQFWQVGTPAWHARIGEMFAALDAWEATSNGAYIRPRLHMMRAQSQAHLYAFDSSDSTNVVVNSHRYRAEGGDYVARFAQRASAKIVATSGPEAEHQIKRPLKGHLEAAAFELRMQALLEETKVELERAAQHRALVELLADTDAEISVGDCAVPSTINHEGTETMRLTLRIYPKSQFNADGRFVGTALEQRYSDRNMAVDCLLALRKTLHGAFVSLTDDQGGNIYPTQRDLARNKRSA